MATEPNKDSKISIDNSGGLVTPLYAERRMKCYHIFDSELKSLGLATAIVSICIALGTACLTTALNISRDIILSGRETDASKALQAVMTPACYLLTGVFYVAAVGALWWRHDLIKTIKQQSGDEQNSPGGIWRVLRFPISRDPPA